MYIYIYISRYRLLLTLNVLALIDITGCGAGRPACADCALTTSRMSAYFTDTGIPDKK